MIRIWPPFYYDAILAPIPAHRPQPQQQQRRQQYNGKAVKWMKDEEKEERKENGDGMIAEDEYMEDDDDFTLPASFQTIPSLTPLTYAIDRLCYLSVSCTTPIQSTCRSYTSCSRYPTHPTMVLRTSQSRLSSQCTSVLSKATKILTYSINSILQHLNQ